MSLVDVVDEVLDMLEADDEMRFTLDGQLATVDDYLEIRPEAEERIRALVRGGRLAIGPWQTLVDEFLVSGESIFRNLEAGLARAEELGGSMRIGYLPDSFGHIAQMPQILRSFGIKIAVVWRGVPASVETHAFAWESPDGTRMRAEYLPGLGYSSAAWAFPDDGSVDTFDAVVDELRPWYGDDTVVTMGGTDHMPPIKDVIARTRGRATVATLAETLADARTEGLHVVRGELRSAARANLLPNVISTRIDIKQACAGAERALERYAEPLQALYGDEWPAPFLELAWSRLHQNAAHDSICGCSADEVSAQVLVRYAEARQIADELTKRALARIAAQAPRGEAVVVNPSPFERTEVVDVDGAPALVTVPPLGYTTQTGLVSHRHEALLDVDVRALTRIVRGRDVGDSYNYAPPEDDVLVGEPEEESLQTIEDGPLRRIVELARRYRWDEELVATTTRFEMRAGEPFVRISVTFDNPCDDQRVRIHVALPEDASTTWAEGQFAIVERPPMQEPGHGEIGLGAYPASAFVSAGGIALLLDHVTEYELVSSTELALTMLRSVGLISRADNPWRTVNAGPELAIPAAQLRGPRSFRFAWCADPDNALVHAERFRHPLLLTTGTGPDDGTRNQTGPELSGAVLSSLRRRDGVLEARIWNPGDAPTTARFGKASTDLRPWEIRRICLDL